MAVTVQGVRVKNIIINIDDNGSLSITGSYQLMANTGKVIANQTFNGYNDTKLEFGVKEKNRVEDALNAVKETINSTLGLE